MALESDRLGLESYYLLANAGQSHNKSESLSYNIHLAELMWGVKILYKLPGTVSDTWQMHNK